RRGADESRQRGVARPSHDHRRSRADPATSVHGDPHRDYPQCRDSRLLSPLGGRRPTEKSGAPRGDAKVPHHSERDGPRSTSWEKGWPGTQAAEPPPGGRRTGWGAPPPPERPPAPAATRPDRTRGRETVRARSLSEKMRMTHLTNRSPQMFRSERGLSRATESSGEVRKGGDAPLRVS